MCAEIVSKQCDPTSLPEIIHSLPRTGLSLHEASPKQLKTIEQLKILESTLQTISNIFKTI